MHMCCVHIERPSNYWQVNSSGVGPFLPLTLHSALHLRPTLWFRILSCLVFVHWPIVWNWDSDIFKLKRRVSRDSRQISFTLLRNHKHVFTWCTPSSAYRAYWKCRKSEHVCLAFFFSASLRIFAEALQSPHSHTERPANEMSDYHDSQSRTQALINHKIINAWSSSMVNMRQVKRTNESPHWPECVCACTAHAPYSHLHMMQLAWLLSTMLGTFSRMTNGN